MTYGTRDFPSHLAEIRSPDLARLAEGFGARALVVDEPDALATLAEALSNRSTGVTVVDVRINPDYESASSWTIAQHVTWGATV